MQKLRSLHLYLGCIFAPLLLFFAVSGIWQMLGMQAPLLKRLSSIHTAHGGKNGDGLSSSGMKFFVLLMALAFIITTILGIVLAVKYDRSRRAAWICLALGVVIPMALIIFCRSS